MYLSGVGPQRAESLQKELGISTFGDLAYYFPYKYIDKSKFYYTTDIRSDAVNVQLKGVISNFRLEGEKHKQRLVARFTDEKGSTALRTYIVNSDRTLDFPYLKAGKYMIRISSDQNNNGLSDTGNLLAHRQPEPVRFYEAAPGNKVLDIPESSEIEQHINIKEMFR